MKKRFCRFMVYGAVCCAVLLAAQFGSLAVTTIAENAPLFRRHCIILDAGHGGVDGGAVSCTGKPESGYNLEIALRLNDLFHLLGMETRMIRREDISVYTQGATIAQKKVSDLKERLRIVNETEGGILLSIHQNTFSDSRYHGPQVFYGKTEGSDAFAAALQSALTAALDPDSSRKSKESRGVYLMEHIQRPGVLIECGFLSNPAEEALLQNARYQKKLCAVIATTTASFLASRINTNT